MSDYINRQAAIELCDWYQHEFCECDYAFGELANELHKLPSADVQPVRHGVWMEENRRPRSAMFYCSECHRTAYDIQPTRDKTWEKRCRYAYCPNCGARMLKYTGMEREQNG